MYCIITVGNIFSQRLRRRKSCQTRKTKLCCDSERKAGRCVRSRIHHEWRANTVSNAEYKPICRRKAQLSDTLQRRREINTVITHKDEERVNILVPILGNPFDACIFCHQSGKGILALLGLIPSLMYVCKPEPRDLRSSRMRIWCTCLIDPGEIEWLHDILSSLQNLLCTSSISVSDA